MFFIYKGFESQGALTSFTKMQWARSYNSVGNFEVELPFDKEIFKLLEIGNYIYKKDTKEACVILERYVRTGSTGEILLTVKGKSLSCFLNDRIFSYTGSINLYDFLNKIIGENFITPKNQNRRIENFTLKDLPKELKEKSLTLEYKNVEVLKALEECLIDVGYGFRVNFLISEKAFELEIYKGNKSDAIFSFEFNNISEQEYYENYADEKNVIVSDSGTYSNDELKGLERKETTGDLQNPVKDLEFIIIDNSIQYKYLEDWNLGDTVTAEDSLLDISVNKSITGIEEFIEHTGTYITVSFKN